MLPLNSVHQMDWNDFMATFEDESVDLVLTDPPYESLERWRGGTTTRMGLGSADSESWDPEKFFATIPNKDLLLLLWQIRRVLKPDRHALIMCDGETVPWLMAYLGRGPSNAAFSPARFDFAKLLVWDKVTIGLGYHFRARHEYVLMLDKGKNRRPKDITLGDVFQERVPKGDAKLYPTQKPWRLFSTLVVNLMERGELVVDPFVGSGTTAIAAIVEGMHYIVNDKNPEAVNITNMRIASCPCKGEQR